MPTLCPGHAKMKGCFCLPGAYNLLKNTHASQPAVKNVCQVLCIYAMGAQKRDGYWGRVCKGQTGGDWKGDVGSM